MAAYIEKSPYTLKQYFDDYNIEDAHRESLIQSIDEMKSKINSPSLPYINACTSDYEKAGYIYRRRSKLKTQNPLLRVTKGYYMPLKVRLKKKSFGFLKKIKSSEGVRVQKSIIPAVALNSSVNALEMHIVGWEKISRKKAERRRNDINFHSFKVIDSCEFIGTKKRHWVSVLSEWIRPINASAIYQPGDSKLSFDEMTPESAEEYADRLTDRIKLLLKDDFAKRNATEEEKEALEKKIEGLLKGQLETNLTHRFSYQNDCKTLKTVRLEVLKSLQPLLDAITLAEIEADLVTDETDGSPATSSLMSCRRTGSIPSESLTE